MFPRIGPIPTYSLFYFTAMVVHLVLLLLFARRLKLSPALAWVLGTAFVLAMIVGAKALFDLQRGIFRPSLLVSLDHYYRGGMWGGPLAYLTLAVPIVLIWGRPRLEALDLVAYALPLPMIIAKLGCICQGCCHGRACQWFWAYRFPSGGSAPAGMPIHPTQAYEILVLTAILVAFVVLNKPSWRGMMLPWFIVLYGCGRSVVEVWRGDRHNTLLIGPFSLSQVVLLCSALAALLVLLVVRRLRIEESMSPATLRSQGVDPVTADSHTIGCE